MNLYQELILDHSRNPRNFGKLSVYTNIAHGNNLLCGDIISVYLNIVNQNIQQISFIAQGCAISVASASIMTDELRNKSVSDAYDLFLEFRNLLTVNTILNVRLKKAKIFSDVKNFPARVKCATLPWHTFTRATNHIYLDE